MAIRERADVVNAPAWAIVGAAVGLGAIGYLDRLDDWFAYEVAAVALLLLLPFRRGPLVFWPALAGVAGFTGGWLAFAPLGCSVSAATVRLGSMAYRGDGCESALGLFFPGYPSLAQGVVAGLVCAAGAAAITVFGVRRWVARRARTSATA